MFYLSLFTFVFFVAVTMADVKKEHGEFRLNHTDNVQKNIALQRQYSSRSLFKGYFGFNWCSTLDFKLSITNGEISVYDCDVGKTITFEKSDSRLVKQAVYYLYKKPNLTYFFSLEGRLSHWITSGGDTIYIIYNNDRMAQLISKTKKSLTISVSYDGLIQKIGDDSTYEYTQGVLQRVLKNKKMRWQYQYDEFLNMTHWRSQTHNELMKYDSEWDRIVFFKDKNDCRFHFQYEIKEAKKYIFESQKCLNTNEHTTLFEVIGPRLLVKSPNDSLGKEFRNADSFKQGANNVQTF